MFLFNNRTVALEIYVVRFVLAVLAEIELAVAEVLGAVLDVLILISVSIYSRSAFLATVLNFITVETFEENFNVETFDLSGLLLEALNTIRVRIVFLLSAFTSAITIVSVSVEVLTGVFILIGMATAISTILDGTSIHTILTRTVQAEKAGNGWFRNNRSLPLIR